MAARTEAASKAFLDSLTRLNTAEALAAVFEFVRDANSAMDSGEFRAGNAGRPLWRFSTKFDKIFDVLHAYRSDECQFWIRGIR